MRQQLCDMPDSRNGDRARDVHVTGRHQRFGLAGKLMPWYRAVASVGGGAPMSRGYGHQRGGMWSWPARGSNLIKTDSACGMLWRALITI